MTISIAWVRNVGATKELVVASDSRLSFGCRWDCCPKVLALPRGDAAMCFAGNTMYAYPVMLQAIVGRVAIASGKVQSPTRCDVAG